MAAAAEEADDGVAWPTQPTTLTPALTDALLALDTPFICDARVRLGLPESFLDPELLPLNIFLFISSSHIPNNSSGDSAGCA